MSGRRLEISATQAVSSMLATITGAIAASGLGIAGTLIGAGFMSLASTVGTAVYRLYISRSNDRLKAAAASLAPRATGSVVAAALVRRHRAPAAGQATPDAATQPQDSQPRATVRLKETRQTKTRPDQQRAGSARPGASPASMPEWAYAADAAETTVIPPLAAASTRPGRPLPGWPAGNAAGTEAAGPRPADTEAGDAPAARTDAAADTRAAHTRAAGTETAGTETAGIAAAATEAAGTGGADSKQPAGADPHPARDPSPGKTGRARGLAALGRRRWLMAGLAALGVFVLGMGAVTAFEAIAGKPLETVVWHKTGSGTTVGGLVDGPPAPPRHTHPAGSTSPSAPASPSSTPTTTSPATPAPTPTPTPTGSSSAAPTPSDSPSTPVSPSPTGSPTTGTPSSPGAPAG
ncbi:MAG TPA: hypothetical protein VFV41_14590 [Streptosporangiaceae bacterium]|nr:hypothetical protein [Streptosporangiaceae bacterium]